MQEIKSKKRQRAKCLRVYALPSEEADIKANAANCGMKVAEYLRNLGLNFEPKTILDYQAVLELSKVSADLGRLGGLLKMFLTNEERYKHMNKEEVQQTVNALLKDISITQARLFEKAKQV